MTFQTRPSTYLISLAPTGRAHCRRCKRRVERGELRIAITAFVRPNRSTTLVRCCRCVDAKFADAVLSVYSSADRVPAEAAVPAADAARARAKLDAARGGVTASNMTHRESDNIRRVERQRQATCRFALTSTPQPSPSATV